MTLNVVLVFVFFIPLWYYVTVWSRAGKVLIYHAIRGYNFSVLTKEPLFDGLLYSVSRNLLAFSNTAIWLATLLDI